MLKLFPKFRRTHTLLRMAAGRRPSGTNAIRLRRLQVLRKQNSLRMPRTASQAAAALLANAAAGDTAAILAKDCSFVRNVQVQLVFLVSVNKVPHEIRRKGHRRTNGWNIASTAVPRRGVLILITDSLEVCIRMEPGCWRILVFVKLFYPRLVCLCFV